MYYDGDQITLTQPPNLDTDGKDSGKQHGYHQRVQTAMGTKPQIRRSRNGRYMPARAKTPAGTYTSKMFKS